MKFCANIFKIALASRKTATLVFKLYGQFRKNSLTCCILSKQDSEMIDTSFENHIIDLLEFDCKAIVAPSKA